MRFCGNCGTRLEDGMRFCPNCGAPTPEDAARTTTQTTAQTDAQTQTDTQTQTTGAFAGTQTASDTANTTQSEPLHAEVVTQAPTPAPKTNGFAIAGLVLGICSILFGWLCCFNITSVLGIVFSIIGLCQTSGGKGNGKGLAVAGLVLSILSILLLVGFGLLSQASEIYFSPNGDFYRIYDDILSQI